MHPLRFACTSTLTNNELSPSELSQIAAAVDLQITRDVPPIWPSAIGTIQAFPDPAAVPFGYCPAVIVDVNEMPQGALGFHYTQHREPAAKIGFDPSAPEGVTTTMSHEVIESLIDPSGNRLLVATLPWSRERVKVLVEACDPPEAFTYTVDQLPVSDFVTRTFFGPHRWRAAMDEAPPSGSGAGGAVTRSYSFCGRLDAPLVVARGGYLSYVKADGSWEQLTWFGGSQPQIRVLGRRDDADQRSHREWLDSLTEEQAFPAMGEIGN